MFAGFTANIKQNSSDLYADTVVTATKDYANDLADSALDQSEEDQKKKGEMEKMKRASTISDLLVKSIAPSWTARTIAEDLKASSEVDGENLKEIHILSDVLLEYDINTYSLMIIAGNLLGLTSNNRYDPVGTGVKYFYYFFRYLK